MAPLFGYTEGKENAQSNLDKTNLHCKKYYMYIGLLKHGFRIKNNWKLKKILEVVAWASTHGLVELVRNQVAHGDARDGKWRGNWRMEWVASTLTPHPNVVYPALLKLMRTPRLPAFDWTDAPHRFEWTRPFRGKTKSGFCACAITFRTSYTSDR